MTKKQLRLSISLTTLLWSIALVSAFLAGWVLPSPVAKSKLIPVVIANRELDDLNVIYGISASDVSLVLRPEDSVPDDAATRIEQVEGAIIDRVVHKGSYIFINDIRKFGRQISTVSIPPGKKVVNVKVPWNGNQTLLHLLDPGDRVSIDYELSDSSETTGSKLIAIADNAWIRGVSRKKLPSYPGFALIGVLIDDEIGEKISEARKSDGIFRIGAPRN